MFPERFGPTGTRGITIDEVDALFRNLGSQAFEDGALRAGVKPLEIANARANAAKEIAAWVQGYSPKLAKFWEGLNTDYARTQAIVRVLRTPTTISDKTGKLDMQAVQQNLKDPLIAKDLQDKLTPEQVRVFYNSVFRQRRGLEGATKTDWPAHVPQAVSETGKTAGLVRTLSQLRPSRYVGENAPQTPTLESLAKWVQRGGVAASSAVGGYSTP